MILSGLICGALLGFVMQRGRFCLTGGFRDMYIAKNNRMFYALLIAISVQSVGVFALIQAGLLTYEAGAIPGPGGTSTRQNNSQPEKIPTYNSTKPRERPGFVSQ